MNHFRVKFYFNFVFFFLFLIAGHGAEIKLDSSSFGGIKARMIGPAIMSGRITDIKVVNVDTRIIYVATASGGIWKSVNGGTTFKQIFDDHTMSVECIDIDQKNPDTLWAGTGECNVRNSVSVGTGLYKSTNGGKTWTFVHFKESERISKVLIHPVDSKTVYVAVMGHLWDANQERGLYKTTDGGKTWNRILFVDENTGCVDLELDPQEPDVLYAAMWQFRRKPYFFNSGGRGSGLFKSLDGGKNWKKLTRGLPRGKLGRIALAVSPSRPGTLYATVESEKTALYRSDVMGEDWKKVNDTISVNMRPFYFSHLIVDPNDHTRLYVTGLFVASSENGGKSFNFGFFGSVHADIHALWVNPHDSNHIIVGTDGGVYISYDQGQHFDMVASLPVSQFYHVYYDMQKPYNLYGGLQDNGSWMGPSRAYGYAGIQNKEWNNVGGGDGFYVFPHPRDPHIIYWEWQGGHLSRLNQKT
ncbi:MAG: glycosyl hydrolase, partial [Candidatus Aminicenantes bacterium]|nr:glycosyl hydrolase [Candidatus Aminicenantes bacterium]